MGSLFALLCLASSGVAIGQTLHPFGNGTHLPNAWAALQGSTSIDLSRNGSQDIYSQAVFLFNFIISLDRDGNRLNQATVGMLQAPAYPASSLPMMQGAASTDLNGDQLEDLVGIFNSGAVVVFSNAGSHLLSNQSVGAGQVIDFFGPGAVINPPFLVYSNPLIRVVDVDGDMRKDIVAASGRIDVWTGQTLPGELFLYHNTATGFVKHTLPQPGNVIDLEVADLNADGVLDHIVLVTETSGWGAGAFGYDLHHATFQPASTPAFAYSTFPLPLMGRVSSLEIGDVMGTTHKDYVFSQIQYSQYAGATQVTLFEGDGQGGLLSSGSQQMTLPSNTTGLGETVFSVRLDDVNRDGTMDMLMIRNFATGVPFGSSQSPSYANAEVLVALGPSLQFSTAESINLGGLVLDNASGSSSATWMPIFAIPDAIQPIDLETNRSRDWYVGQVLVLNGTSSSQAHVVLFKNSTPVTQGESNLETVGGPSGGVTLQPGRLGFDLGKPVQGNAQFGVNVQGIQSGSLVGFVWSSVGIPNLWNTPQGIVGHLVPMEYSHLYTAQGNGATGGFARCPLPIPNVPAIVGDAGFFQCAYFDPVVGRFGGTEAAHVTVGQ